MKGEMTWLEYYQAVRRGDLDAVKNASDKNFRISLTMNKSAFELAALFGHLNLVEYFVQNSDKRKDFQLLSMVHKDGLRGGYLEISELLWNFIDDKSEMTGDFVMPAMDGKNLDCLKLVYGTEVKNRCSPSQYVVKACEVGWSEGLKFIEHAEDKVGVLIQETMRGVYSSQCMFVDVGLNDLENVMETVKSPPKHRDWFRRRNPNVVAAPGTNRRTARFIYWSVFEVAAHFGHLDILKYLIEEVTKLNPVSYSLRKELRSAFKFGLRNNQRHVLQYFIESGLVEPRPPFEYEGYRVNDAFYYLMEKTKPLSGTEGVEGNVMDCMKVLWSYEDSPTLTALQAEWFTLGVHERHKVFADEGTKFWLEDRSASRLANIESYYDGILEYMKPAFLSEDVHYYFMIALAHQNADAAISFRKRMNEPVPCTSVNFHELFSEAMCFGRLFGRRKRIVASNDHLIPSPVIVELLLSVSNSGGKSCSCGLLNPMTLFLRTARLREVRPYLDFAESVHEKDVQLPLAVLTRTVESVMEVLVDNGASKPTPDMVRDMANFMFCPDVSVSSVYAARFLAALNCTLVRDLIIDNLSTETADWFVKKWAKRDEFLTDFLIAYSANGWKPYLETDCFLVYFARPKARREHFIHCLIEAGVHVQDYNLDRYFNHRDRVEGDSNDKRLTKIYRANSVEKVLSLQSLTRLSIHSHCRKLTSASRKYVSGKKLVASIAQSLPQPLAEFLQFSDVYERLGQVPPKMAVHKNVLAVMRRIASVHQRYLLGISVPDSEEESESESEDESDSETENESGDETDYDDDEDVDDDDESESEMSVD